ncbi:MAG TPA: hypothetical protein DIV86_05630, partial [Alphaproteobacteria bacterium]|nr:hypothetical protein [Alphaproteobacteria bacterium]
MLPCYNQLITLEVHKVQKAINHINNSVHSLLEQGILVRKKDYIYISTDFYSDNLILNKNETDRTPLFFCTENSFENCCNYKTDQKTLEQKNAYIFYCSDYRSVNEAWNSHSWLHIYSEDLSINREIELARVGNPANKKNSQTGFLNDLKNLITTTEISILPDGYRSGFSSAVGFKISNDDALMLTRIALVDQLTGKGKEPILYNSFSKKGTFNCATYALDRLQMVEVNVKKDFNIPRHKVFPSTIAKYIRKKLNSSNEPDISIGFDAASKANIQFYLLNNQSLPSGTIFVDSNTTGKKLAFEQMEEMGDKKICSTVDTKRTTLHSLLNATPLSELLSKKTTIFSAPQGYELSVTTKPFKDRPSTLLSNFINTLNALKNP